MALGSIEYGTKYDERRLELGGHFLDHAAAAGKESQRAAALAMDLRGARDDLEAIKRKLGKTSHKRAQLRFVLNQVIAEAMEILRAAPELLPELPNPVVPEVRDRFNANYYDFDLPQRILVSEEDVLKKLGRVDVDRY